MYIDDPIQYFFTFNANVPLTSTKGKDLSEIKRMINTQELRDVGLPATGKVTIFGQAQNQLLIRLTNYADKFDLGENYTIPYVKID
jgi:hypothetical protein